MKTIIYYFTATGNSLFIAKKLASSLENCKIMSIPKVKDKKVNADTIGFVFPIYYQGLPRIVKKFLKDIKINKNAYIFAAINYGMTNGGAMKQLKSILKNKGYSLNAGMLIQLPDNYIPMLKLPNKKRQKHLLSTAIIKIECLIDIIHKKSKLIETGNPLFNMISPFLYKKWLKTLPDIDQSFYVLDYCNGCGICASICPVKNISQAKEKNFGKPIWGLNGKCEECLACIHACPTLSIQINKKTEAQKRYRNPYISLKEIIIGNKL